MTGQRTAIELSPAIGRLRDPLAGALAILTGRGTTECGEVVKGVLERHGRSTQRPWKVGEEEIGEILRVTGLKGDHTCAHTPLPTSSRLLRTSLPHTPVSWALTHAPGVWLLRGTFNGDPWWGVLQTRDRRLPGEGPWEFAEIGDVLTVWMIPIKDWHRTVKVVEGWRVEI